MANASDRAQVIVDRLLHDAHVRYQRQQMRPDATHFPASEVRGLRREPSKCELTSYACVWRPEWFHHVRPNTIRAFIDATQWYAKHLR